MAGSWSEFCVLALHSFSCSQLKAYLLALCCDTNLLSATRYMEQSVVAESLTAGKSADRQSQVATRSGQLSGNKIRLRNS